jgi:hypothetical protein
LAMGVQATPQAAQSVLVVREVEQVVELPQTAQPAVQVSTQVPVLHEAEEALAPAAQETPQPPQLLLFLREIQVEEVPQTA